nr:ATP-dependent zinc metalloprotease FTSH, chloroplastic [Tanacetum cinerariifolium]
MTNKIIDEDFKIMTNKIIDNAMLPIISKMDNLIKRIEQHLSGSDVRSLSSSSCIVNDLGSSMINNNDMEVVSDRKYGENVVKCGKQDDAHQVFYKISMNKILQNDSTVQEYFDAFSLLIGDKDRDERYLIDLFICGLHLGIKEKVRWYRHRSLSDACSLAGLEEARNKLLKKRDEERGKLELFGNCSRGFVKMDGVNGEKYVENGSKFKKIDESHEIEVGVHWDEDSIMDVDQVCEEVGKCSELKLIVSCKVDVDGMLSDTKVQDVNENDGDKLNKGIDHSKAVKDDSIDLEFCDDEKGNEGQSSGEEIHNCGLKILGRLGDEKVEGIWMNPKGLVKLDDKNKGNVSLDSSKEADVGISEIKNDNKDLGLFDCGCDKAGMTTNESTSSQFLVIEINESKYCVKEGGNDLEMVVDKLVEKMMNLSALLKNQLWKYDEHKESLVGNGKEYDGKQGGKKEDGEFVHVSEEIKLSNHCCVDIVKSFEVDQTNNQKSKVPRVLFIDEFDSVGKQKRAGLRCGNNEREQMLNELLTDWLIFLAILELY